MQTWARFLTLFVLLFIQSTTFTACVSEIEISLRPIMIGPEWIELKPKSPMKEKFDYQRIHVEVTGCFTDLLSLSSSIDANGYEYQWVEPKGCFTSLYHLKSAQKIFGETESYRINEVFAQLGFPGSPYPQIIFLPDGEKVIIKAEFISADGHVLKLNSGGTACPAYDRRCLLTFSSSFPDDVAFSTLRLWSSKPITVSQIRWVDTTVF